MNSSRVFVHPAKWAIGVGARAALDLAEFLLGVQPFATGVGRIRTQGTRGAFRVRHALCNQPARVAEAARGKPARVRDLLVLSAGYGDGRRRRVIFKRYPALDGEALNAPDERRRRQIGGAADEGRPVATIAELSCRAGPESDLGGALEADVVCCFDGEEKAEQRVSERLRRWRVARPSRKPRRKTPR